MRWTSESIFTNQEREYLTAPRGPGLGVPPGPKTCSTGDSLLGEVPRETNPHESTSPITAHKDKAPEQKLHGLTLHPD